MAARRARARRRPRRVAEAVAVAAAIFGMCAAAVEIRAESKNDKDVTRNAEKGWAYARMRGISKDPVLLPLIMEQPGSEDIFVGLTRYFEKAVTNGYTPKGSNCALHDQPWVKNVPGFSALRDWPQTDTTCVSSNRPVSGDRSSSVDAEPLMNLMASNLDLINEIGPGVVRKLDLNFSNPNMARAWDHEEGTLKRCKVWRNTGVRFKPSNSDRFQWYFIQGITNDDPLKDFAEWERMYVNEFIGVDDTGKFVEPLPMHIRPWPRPDPETGEQVNPGEGSDIEDENGNADLNISRSPFATSLEMWDGRVTLSSMYEMPIVDSPALITALDDSELNADQAVDAITPSNVAILALPMVLNVIPVALIADVSSFGLFIYTIATDILTTVPFIIKGVELIIAGTSHYRAQEIWFTGVTNFTVAEAWACDCTLNGVRRRGTIFVAVGLSFLILGVVAEWWARRLRARWIADGTLDVPKHDHLKAHLLQRDLRMEAGLSPEKATNPDEIEEERAFLLHQSSLRDPPSPPATASSSRRASSAETLPATKE